MESIRFEYNDFLACCGSTKFAKEMASMSPFTNLDEAVHAARDIWFNKVDVAGWIEAFSAHPQIGQTPSSAHPKDMSAQWSKGEQSTALATGTATTLQELADWNAKYRQKFGSVFLICASGRGTLEILNELKRRYSNRPIVEFEIAAQEQMKITELRLAMLFSAKINAAAPVDQHSSTATTKAGEDRMSIIGAHLASASEKNPQASTRTRPPVTSHVLDIGRGCPASGIEVHLEIWKGKQHPPSFADADFGSWMLLGSATTDRDGRSGQLMSTVDDPKPGIYRISFDTGKYYPMGFFPFVSIVFKIKESQKFEHFHVPLLLSPFSFSTYRGS
ncbi:hypothetical protein Nepgr_002512 [Nepenthes gracilis]|uniref:Hydroxyisourate hydrolase n=1 Tax=Nepenthes gracilis TaxID=150966 RepID=A0AAD3P737_NEPGR|nr:hypothetical protein Nepgr_002512 [Nepenthes gracilis]